MALDNCCLSADLFTTNLQLKQNQKKHHLPKLDVLVQLMNHDTKSCGVSHSIWCGTATTDSQEGSEGVIVSP